MRTQSRAAPAGRRGRTKKSGGESNAAARILQAALQEDCNVGELADLACADPVFAGRVLAWVNSPAFRRSRPVVDLRQATSLIGVRGLRNIALGMVLSGMVPPSPEAEVLLANGLRRALGAHSIAEQVAREHADAAFTAGLFLEVGILAHANENLSEASTVARSPANNRAVQERALGRIPHPQASAAIARGYHLPEDIIDAISHHHDDAMPQAPLSQVAWAAERLAAVFEGGSIEQARSRAREAAEAVGLKPDVLEALFEMLPVMVTDCAKIFDREVGEQRSFEDLLCDANAQLLEMNEQYEVTVAALEAVIQEKELLAAELQEANARLEKLASHDPLTGLVNRRVMQSELDHHLALATRQDTQLSVALVDLDHFKKVNDTYGHDAGDAVLKLVANALKESLRACDIVARFGGEEFVLVLPNTNAEQAELVLNRTRELVASTPIPISDGPDISVTASIGATCTKGTKGEASSVLLKMADTCLYRAKDSGRNRVVMG